MSNNGEDEKSEPGKTFPLDLAAKMSVKTLDCKNPVLMAGQHLRNVRVLTPGQTSVVTPTIITTGIVPQAVIKQCEVNRSQVSSIINATQTQSQGGTSITIQRPAQIAIATSLPLPSTTLTGVGQNTYHVPRGPAVVANLAAPRSNVASSIRTPMVVTAQTNIQTQNFVRPPRTPSPAQGTAWLTTNSTNGSQIKGAPTVLSSPVRGASVTGALGKPQLLTKSQTVAQNVSTIRPSTTILHSAITIGQGAQIHPFKPGQAAAGIQTIGNTVTLTQVLPSRSQTLVYSAGGNGTQFTTAPRLTVSTTMQNRQIPSSKPVAQLTTARLAVPISVTQAGQTRLVTPQGTVLTTGARISNVTNSQQPTIIGTTPARIVSTTQSNVTLGRLSVSVGANPVQASNTNVLGQARISTLSLHPVVAVANNNQTRAIQAQGAKVITQTMPGNTLHIPQISQIPAVIKPAPAITTSSRTINLQPAGMVTQRPISTGTSQAISISKVFSQQIENQQPTTNIYIHAPIASVPRKTSPGPTVVTQSTTTVSSTSSISTYSLASGTYFYDATYSVARPFNQQSSFAAVPQSTNQQIRSTALNAQVHNIVANQPMRFNPVMVVEQNRLPQFSQQQQEQELQDSAQHVVTSNNAKITSSPRPSILRKRDHDGTLKAAKNLAPQLGILPIQTQPPVSPPSRPDSGENGNSSAGSTTLSATSSPGIAETNEDSLSHLPINVIKEEEESVRPPLGISPRKKPRKQQLMGNDIDDQFNEDMQFLSESNIKKDVESDGNQSDAVQDEPLDNQRIVHKPTTPSLLNSYKQTWKATHNHYLRYADVRPKDERRPTIIDLSNQNGVMDKINGWKVYHLSTQMEDLADQEQNVYNQLRTLLKETEAEEVNGCDKDVNRINELIKGNMQRIKIINDGMLEAKSQIMKIFDHKHYVVDIINHCASKRSFKKRDKS